MIVGPALNGLRQSYTSRQPSLIVYYLLVKPSNSYHKPPSLVSGKVFNGFRVTVRSWDGARVLTKPSSYALSAQLPRRTLPSQCPLERRPRSVHLAGKPHCIPLCFLLSSTFNPISAGSKKWQVLFSSWIHYFAQLSFYIEMWWRTSRL